MKKETVDAVFYLVSVRLKDSENHFLRCARDWGDNDEMTKCARRELNRWESVRNDLMDPTDQ